MDNVYLVVTEAEALEFLSENMDFITFTENQVIFSCEGFTVGFDFEPGDSLVDIVSKVLAMQDVQETFETTETYYDDDEDDFIDCDDEDDDDSIDCDDDSIDCDVD